MVFQNIIFKHTNSQVSNSLQTIAAQKLSTLEKYTKGETDVRCEVEFERIVKHKSGDVCRVEANIWLSGVLFRAEATQATFEAAIDIVRDELNQEMGKAHEKRNSLIRRGGRKIKDMVRFGR
jgi:ribosomal subunit interface protein